jgi:hypothetical protein
MSKVWQAGVWKDTDTESELPRGHTKRLRTKMMCGVCGIIVTPENIIMQNYMAIGTCKYKHRSWVLASELD